MIALLLAAALAGEVDGPGVVRLVAAHRGRPVVVHFWATWCEPCALEFPDLVALARERTDAAVLSVSIDEPEDRAAVLAFLSRQDPPFPTYLKAPGKDDAFIDGVDRDWSGVVPATLVFDRQGRRVALLQGEHRRADIERALAGAGP